MVFELFLIKGLIPEALHFLSALFPALLDSGAAKSVLFTLKSQEFIEKVTLYFLIL
jgi:hypothetical protein